MTRSSAGVPGGPGPGRRERGRIAARVAVAVAILATGAWALTRDSGSGGAAPDDAATTSTHTEHGFAGPVPWEPLDEPERARLDRQLDAARAAAAGVSNPDAARAAGYEPTTPYQPLEGAHWVHWDMIDEPFDPGRPSQLLFDGDGPDAGLAGLSYFVVSDGEPDGFAGPNDRWHQHPSVCWARVREEILGDYAPDECRRRGGVFEDATHRWMLHVWVVPDRDNPWGLFATGNPHLR